MNNSGCIDVNQPCPWPSFRIFIWNVNLAQFQLLNHRFSQVLEYFFDPVIFLKYSFGPVIENLFQILIWPGFSFQNIYLAQFANIYKFEIKFSAAPQSFALCSQRIGVAAAAEIKLSKLGFLFLGKSDLVAGIDIYWWLIGT